MICWQNIFNLIGNSDFQNLGLSRSEFSSFKNLTIKTKDWKMKKILFLVVVGFLFFTSDVFPQTVTVNKFKLPRFTLEVAGGYSLPLFDLSGSSHSSFYSFQNYAQSDGFATAIKGNLCLGKVSKRSTMDLYLILGYNHYSKSENNAYNVGQFPPGWPQNPRFYPPAKIMGQSYLRMNIPYVVFGAEYKLFLDDYFRTNFAWGIGISASDITGRIYNTPFNGSETFNTFHGSFRLGVGTHLQLSHRFSPLVGFVIGSKLDINNLLLKNTSATDNNAWMYLNDEGKPAINPLISSDRTIGSVSFYGGVSFYFGVKK